jgi:glycosyltransferase involved in cell wall biosynthesis
MHVLVLPKWYPGLPDPQLGDFIRKQMMAVAQLHQVSVIYPCPVSLPTAREEILDQTDGAWELRCYYRPSTVGFMPFRKILNYIRYRRAVRVGVARLLHERGRPDLVHAHILTRPVLTAFMLSRKWKIPYMASEQSSVHLNGTWQRKSGMAKAVDRFLFRHASRTTAVSAHLATALERAGLGRDHAVVPNVIPGMDRPLPPLGPHDHFMMVADLVDSTKNVSGTLRALASARAHGHDLHLEVIGDGPDRELLHQLAEELGVGPHVSWHGRLPQADVLTAMAGTGTVIINSNFETFSVVTGEALASGKPVIATRCGGPEAFITPENGVLIPVGNDDVLRDAMVRMAQEHGRYSPAAIRASVSQRFSPQAVAKAFDAVYREAIAHG